MAVNHYTEFLEDIEEFKRVTADFYEKKIDVPQYKSFSGGFGSYAQRGAERSMLRLRLAGGEIDKNNLSFIVDSIHKYDIDLIHFTTCQTVQLHNLTKETVCQLVGEAYQHGIITRGGGGDFPRNVMCSPLTGVDKEETFDVLPYVKEAADYLLGFIHKVKLPRKLKVCFSNTPKDEPHATYRDLGFVAKDNQKFDVYIAGGLGIKPKMGVLAVQDIAPHQILYCIKTMVDVFTKYGNYEKRAASRSRFLQDTLGPEELVHIYQQTLKENLKNEDLDIQVQPEHLSAQQLAQGQQSAQEYVTQEPDCNLEWLEKLNETQRRRVIEQKQQGFYAVAYHPIGGRVSPYFFEKMLGFMKEHERIRLRITPEQGVYIINLTNEEACQVLEQTTDGANCEFEYSTACIGASICQVGIGDSQALIKTCVERVRQEHLPDHVLPRIHISGCPSSCSAHQTAKIGFRGGKKPTSEGPQFAFAVYVDGCEILGKEQFGAEVGVMLASDIPEFLARLGREVASKGLTYDAYRAKYPDGLLEIAKEFI